MTRAKDIARLRTLLIRRRRTLLNTATATRHEAQALKDQERDPEYEENAQAELAHYTLSHLVETHRREIMQIDAALQRIEAGVFGVCVDCGADISLDRLEVLPYALRCEEDAARREAELRGNSATPTL